MAEVWALTPWVADESGTKTWAVAADYPAEWSDATSQRDADILAGLDRCVVRGRVSESQYTALVADTRYPLLPESGALAPEQVDAIKAEIAESMSSDVAALVTLDATDAQTIAARMVEAAQYPPWRAGMDVEAGEVYTHERNLYEVVQGHRTQADWTPIVAKALFKRYYEPSDDPWPWVQPLGAHDAYPVGARVLHDGATWVNTIPANVWAPGVTGWEREGGEPEPETPAEWVQPTGGHDAYNIGDRVTFEGNIYESLIDANVWSPTAYPQGWHLIGPA